MVVKDRKNHVEQERRIGSSEEEWQVVVVKDGEIE